MYFNLTQDDIDALRWQGFKLGWIIGAIFGSVVGFVIGTNL